MNLENYCEYLFPTLESYGKRTRDVLEKKILEAGLIKRKNGDEGELTLEDIRAKNANILVGCVNHLGIKAIKIFEEWEFIKNYEYSVLFEATNMSQETLLSNLKDIADEFDILSEEYEALHTTIKEPTYIERDDLIILKFSLSKDAIHPQTGAPLKIKNPILVVFYKNDSVVEIRYGAIKGLFVEDYRQFYSRNLTNVCNWITTKLNIRLDDFLLDKLINDIKENEDVQVDGQDMRFSDGGTAKLQVKESDTLPLLGELKKLIVENEELSEAIAVRQLLETWIKSKEDEAEYTWISLCWPHDNVKWKNIIVKFQFDYFGPDVCLLYHYAGPIGMERMNRVTRYIIQNRERIECE